MVDFLGFMRMPASILVKTWPIKAEAREGDREFYIIMNLAIGGNYGGNPDARTVFPGEMQVDYVRVYENAATKSAP
jgi:beta-glucanase (GH16 family)